MGVAILFHFVFTCFPAVAWPLLSMVYPLYASIEATERNSISDTQKLITYWICFAAILLFEYFASVLLEWLPFWAYVKLSIICYLVAPHFDGSLYMYKRFIHPVHFEAKNYFLEIKANQASYSCKELKITDIIADISLNSNEIEYKNPYEQIENEGVGSIEQVTEITTDVSLHKVDGQDSQGSSSIEKVQDWTCEVCDVKTSSESVFQSHLQGKPHKVAYEFLKSKSESTTGEQGTCSICQTVITTRKDMIQHKANCGLLKTQQPHGYATSVAVPTVLCNSSQHEQGTAKRCTSNEIKNNQWWSSLCNINCSNKGNMDNHLNGSKHLAKIKTSDGDGDTGKTAAMPKLRAEPQDVTVVEQVENEVSLNEAEDRDSQCSSSFEEVRKLIDSGMLHGYATSDVLPTVPCSSGEQQQGIAKNCTSEIKNHQWTCTLCNVSCSSKIMDSHLNGRKHLAKIKKLHGDCTIGKPAVIPNKKVSSIRTKDL